VKILIIDDEPLIRWSLAETLVHEGHEIEEAGDARQTLDVLAGGYRPDVVLLDFRLPDSNDLSLLRSIRVKSPESAVVMMSAYVTPEVVAGAQALGAYGIMNKPVELGDLPALVTDSRAAHRPLPNDH
jgi:DNA-binding NtrC family response regulator